MHPAESRPLNITRFAKPMYLPAKWRTPALLAAVAALVGVLVWTETYAWSRLDRLRQPSVAITTSEVESLHRVQAWSSGVLAVVGGLLGLLVYHGVIAPLRERLRQSQQAIERQEKLSSLGVLAAGVAHEIRNPLTSMRVRLFTQQQLLKPGTEEFEDNVFLADEIARLEKIVKDFLVFARPAEPELVVLKATQPLRELRPLMEPGLARSGVTLHEEFQADPPIRVDAAQLKQVLINLIKNAAEAMPDGGTIHLRTRLERRGLGPRATSVALLEVTDTGPGIPPDVQRRLFDPFFTTKPTGTGLGLSIAARIVEKHGGTLEFSTTPARGTTFRLVLPVAPALPP